MAYTDKSLTCVECGAQFTFSAEDQEYYATRGFQNEPKRCPSCRQSRKAGRQGGREGGGGYRGAGAATAGPSARCTRRSAPSAASRLRSPFSPGVTARSTVATASLSGPRHVPAGKGLT